ncbi:33649_t:CDS:2, partial [Racocetra persica]
PLKYPGSQLDYFYPDSISTLPIRDLLGRSSSDDYVSDHSIEPITKDDFQNSKLNIGKYVVKEEGFQSRVTFDLRGSGVSTKDSKSDYSNEVKASNVKMIDKTPKENSYGAVNQTLPANDNNLIYLHNYFHLSYLLK